jgi:L-fuculose-phosphate aldolase
MSLDQQIKQEIIDTVRLYSANGLGVGTSGNLSARTEKGFLITPTGVSYEALEPQLLVELNIEGEVIGGHLKPSSEWRFHRDIYLNREQAGSIVHVHSPFATAIACTRKSIPAFHYMIAITGGDSIRCAEYATFGTEQLSKYVVKALIGRKACLMANHGMIALDKDISSAFKMAIEVEELAKQYFYSMQIGDPTILDKEEMQINLEKFKSYGKQEE